MWKIDSITRQDDGSPEPGIETYEVSGLFNGQHETHSFVVTQPEGHVISVVHAPPDLQNQVFGPGGSVQLTYEAIQSFHRAVVAARLEEVD